MKKKIVSVKLWMNEHPVSHLEYLDWVVKIANLKTREKQVLEDFFRSILSLADPEWIIEFVVIEINGKKLCFDDLMEYDMKDAIRKFSDHDYKDLIEGVITFPQEIPIKVIEKPKETRSKIKPKIDALIGQYVEQAKNLKMSAILQGNEAFYYYQIPVTPEILFETVEENGQTFKRIRASILPYLRFLDLSHIDFTDVCIQGIDLSYTNIENLDLSKVYLKDASFANLQRVNFRSKLISDAICKGTNLCETYSRIDIDSVDLEGALLDKTCLVFNSIGTIPQTRESSSDVLMHF